MILNFDSGFGKQERDKIRIPPSAWRQAIGADSSDQRLKQILFHNGQIGNQRRRQSGQECHGPEAHPMSNRKGLPPRRLELEKLMMQPETCHFL